MPLYEYEIVLPDGSGGERFEVRQRLADPPLTAHPETGAPCRRVVSAPNAPRMWTDAHAKAATSDSSLERKGFTKYVRGDNGKYRKQFGGGPDSISKPPGS
jgi:hypothetical protein